MVAMAATMPDLHGVADEWDEIAEVRTQIRKHKSLLAKEPWEENIKVDVQHAVTNFAVLKPLVRRLLDSSGSVGMHAQPLIEKQPLDLNDGQFSVFCDLALLNFFMPDFLNLFPQGLYMATPQPL